MKKEREKGKEKRVERRDWGERKEVEMGVEKKSRSQEGKRWKWEGE